MSSRKWRGLPPLEKSEQSQCDDLMIRLGWDVVKFGQRGGRGLNRTSRVTKGIADRRYYRDTDTFWFECKQEDGVQSEDQKKFQARCDRTGELYVLGGLKELTKFLQSWGEKVKRMA
jgi:hypothetical protein